MRATWVNWDLDDMTDAAEEEGWVGVSVLALPERHLLTSLPYHESFSEYRDHVTRCAGCRRDDRPDCPTGSALMEASHTGLMAQHRIALSN